MLRSVTTRYKNFNSSGPLFGHLFYKEPFSHYRLRVEYRFVGEQCPGGPDWAIRNSGVMIHGESPTTHGEGPGFSRLDRGATARRQRQNDTRTTANLCTPGTNVVMDGKLSRHTATTPPPRPITATSG